MLGAAYSEYRPRKPSPESKRGLLDDVFKDAGTVVSDAGKNLGRLGPDISKRGILDDVFKDAGTVVSDAGKNLGRLGPDIS
jgi:hypothetical protein